MLKRLASLHKYKNWSIKVKLLTITILLIVCSVLIVSSLSYYKYTRDFQQQSTERTQQTLEQLSFNVETYLGDLFRLSIAPYSYAPLMDALEQSKPDSELAQLEKRRLIEGFLESMMITPRNDILSVYIMADEVYRGGRFPANNYSNVDCSNFDWYKKASSTNDAIFVPAHMEQIIGNPKFKVFSIVKRINIIKDSEKQLGVIKVDANYTGIETLCNKINMGKDGGLFIIDENNTIIFSSIKSNQFVELSKLVKSNKNPFITTSIGNKRFLLNSTVIPSVNWTIITLNSINELNKNAVQTRNTTFLMAFVCSIFAIIILLIFTRSFLKPLMTIIKLMKEVKHGNFQVEFPEQRNDEIGYLGSSFNSMVLKINSTLQENTNLVKEVYESKFLQKEAQINALYSQIRPHFIYNTLNMISLLIQCGRYEKSVDNINKLSSLLRGMAHLDKEITLQTEISLLEAYLSIQCSRYDGRLEYVIDIDKSFYSYSLPALIFQPIVENSVIHGCEKMKEKTTIKIYNIINNDSLIICFEDNANGMSEETLFKLRKKVYDFENSISETNNEDPDKRNGIGLVNVNRRIKIKYGYQYGLTIDSILGQGTIVKIVLPKHSTLEGNK